MLTHAQGLLQISPEQRLKTAQEVFTYYPGLMQEIIEKMWPMLEQMCDSYKILARLCEGVRAFIEQNIAEKEIFQFEDLLQWMKKQCQNPIFIKEMRKRYRAAIIDEFQDTDPVQWEIFSQLFLPKHGFAGHLYLVGDPKQSIYGFRSADIYTYLLASQEFPEQQKATLNVNYRATAALIHASNVLFSHVTDFFVLPKKQLALDYNQVHPSPIKKNGTKNAKILHFFIEEAKKSSSGHWPSQEVEELFFPFIAEEIMQLHKQDNVPFKECAILVKDRFQAQRMHQFLHKIGLPSILKRHRSLINSRAVPILIELLQAIKNPSNQNAMHKVLASPLFCFTNEDIHLFSTNDGQLKYCQILNYFAHFRDQYAHKGLLSCMEALWRCSFDEQHTVKNRLILQEQGLDIFNDINQLVEWMIELKPHSYSDFSIDYLIDFLQNIFSQDPESENCKARQAPTKDAIQIMTIHMSKGLEFEVVFPIGLIHRHAPRREFINDNARLRIEKEDHPLVLEHRKEVDAEKMRLLYVAMTRARSHLYIPLLFESDCKLVREGHASGMELFLAKLLNKEKVEELCLQDFLSFFDNHLKEHFMSFSYCKQARNTTSNSVNEQIFSLQMPPPPDFTCASFYTHSFSALANPKPTTNALAEDNGPRGAGWGIFVHEFLEKVSWSKLCQAKNPEQLQTLIVSNASFCTHIPYLAQLVFNCLQVNLPPYCLQLKDVNPDKIVREMDFLFAMKSSSKVFQKGLSKATWTFFFEHEGKYFLVDWKTNDLGTAKDAYLPHMLEKVMKENDYFLQIEIYLKACERYLALLDKTSL